MKILIKEHRFVKFLLCALLALAINFTVSCTAGYATAYTITIYAAGIVLLIGFIIMHKMGYEFSSKLLSVIFFNAFFFCFNQYYGLRSMVFIYYFPFLISYIYMYRNSASRKEAIAFTCSCFACIITIFTVCTMDGERILSKEQETIMYKKNFLVAFALSAYYFYAVFNYLMEQMKLAHEASASKARFLSIMSHELRTPLNGIISAINLISTTNDEEEKHRFSVVLKSSSEHLLHLVNNVLDYSKASSGKMELNPVSCSLNKILLNLEAVFQSRFEEKNIGLRLVIDDEVKKNVLLDDIRFVQLISNLLSNALKFTEKGNVVMAARFLGFKNSAVEVEISVTDTGKGLTKEQQNEIFESFNNVNNKSRKIESSGLGLSICKMIVEIMGGRLLVDSQVDKGSKFYFAVSMPLAQAEEKKTAVAYVSYESLEGVKILIAEDNPINMLVSREFLKRWKVKSLEASNGLLAKQMVEQNPDIDLLLLDLQMPEMNGYEVMAWIKESGFTFPVIAFTAQIMSNEEKAELFRLGFTNVIPKPFAPEELQQKLQVALLKTNQPLQVYSHSLTL